MAVSYFRVVHYSKGKPLSQAAATPPDGVAFVAPSTAFHLDTCQRQIWIIAEALDSGAPIAQGMEEFRGEAAYRFLLRVATGLESQVLGETDIFGQLKESWRKFAESANAGAILLAPWIQKLFEDTKEIRSRFLQHVGGESYGSLVRKLIRSHEPLATDSVLLVGAGAIALSVAPWLSEQTLYLSNRTVESLEPLRQEILARNPRADVRLITDAESERRAWREARFAVMCIPVGFPPGSPAALEDERRLEQWRQGRGEGRAIIHLGGQRPECVSWIREPGFHALDDLFALQKGEYRISLIERALKACDERAKLRLLPGGSAGSVSIPHGWEDLAAFA